MSGDRADEDRCEILALFGEGCELAANSFNRRRRGETARLVEDSRRVSSTRVRHKLAVNVVE